jgi:hypothetical protein
MTLWINEQKDSEIRKLGGDIGTTNARLTFSEATYALEADDNQGLLLAYVTEASDTKGQGGVTFKEGIYTLHFTIKDFTKTWFDKSAGKEQSKAVKATEKEAMWHNILTDAMTGNTGFKGHINLGCNLSTLRMLETGLDAKGNPWQQIEALADIVASEAGKLEPCELDKLKGVSTASGGKGGYKSTPAQTELSKLNDRVSFLIAQYPNLLKDCKNLEDVSMALGDTITHSHITSGMNLLNF